MKNIDRLKRFLFTNHWGGVINISILTTEVVAFVFFIFSSIVALVLLFHSLNWIFVESGHLAYVEDLLYLSFFTFVFAWLLYVVRGRASSLLR